MNPNFSSRLQQQGSMKDSAYSELACHLNGSKASQHVARDMSLKCTQTRAHPAQINFIRWDTYLDSLGSKLAMLGSRQGKWVNTQGLLESTLGRWVSSLHSAMYQV